MSAEDTTGGDGGRLTAWKVFPDNNNKGSYNAYEVASTDWEGDPTDVFSVHNNDGSIDTYNSIKDLNKAGITNVNYQRKNDKSVMGNLQMAYDGWVNATGETARAKETMLNYIGGIASTVIPIEGLLLGNTSKALSWGKNSAGHLVKHRDVLGFGNVSAQQAQKIVPELKAVANQLLKNSNPALTRVGQWHGHQNAIMYISNGKMIVTEANGTFITVINKTANQWYNAAKTLR
ncbi:hypothetical protein ACPDHL_07950 [Myroides sp. C15-4]|uniref:hypothetical protein n=1 Tax=Myroides sp. C15-4 TaxID=3400532 RepID=UPI003D2F7BBA